MAQQLIGLRFGKIETDSITVVGCSLSSDDINVNVVGVGPFNINLSELGTDNFPTQDRAGYVGDTSITGLQPYTKYAYTATQGVNFVSGYFWTAPSETDDFILIPITCDNNTVFGGLPAGGYPQARAIAEANPDKGVYFIHMDDHYGYMDFSQLNELGFGHDHKVTGTFSLTNALVYDYALDAFAAFGLYHPSGNAYCKWGQDDDRIWCMRNIPVLPQWGDHDAGNNEMGWDKDPTDATGSPSPLTQFTNAKTVWDAFLLPLQGTLISTGTNAWEHKFGCVKLIAPDGITKASGDGSTTTKPTTIYSNGQVDDVINSCDDLSVPFKLLMMNYGIRWLVDPPTGQSSGAQNPIGGNEGFTSPVAAHAEYARLMTDAGGLMSKSSCNGVMGVLIAVHGDYHAAKVALNKNTVGTFDEWFYSINVGTINGSINFDTSGVTLDIPVDGTTPEVIEGTLGSHDWWVVPFYVYGSREVKEIEVDFMDKNGVTLWNKKFTGRSMNDAINVDFNPAASGSSSDNGSNGF